MHSIKNFECPSDPADRRKIPYKYPECRQRSILWNREAVRGVTAIDMQQRKNHWAQ